jgi:anaerobic magnesium-protoporphyrin IX monomethyl ester cyclase
MAIKRILFVEPPRLIWFVMGEYLPPPTTLLTLAAYVERELPEAEVAVLDCQAEGKDWKGVEKAISSFAPDLVAVSGFTCNVYTCARTAEIAKTIDPDIVTVAGGIHFSYVPEESLRDFPEIDYIVRGEGERTLVELIRTIGSGKGLRKVRGLSFKHKGKVVNNPDRPLIEDLDSLPYPAYHLVEDHISKYHFSMMAGKKAPYLVLEGARGCVHKCSFCTQWKHWGGCWRTKSPKRIVDEIEHLHRDFGGVFIWLADDNFEYRRRGQPMYEELRGRGMSDDIMLFFQARTDDVAANPGLVSKLRRVGNYWVMMGVESDSDANLKEFGKGIRATDAGKAVKTLNDNDIFSHGMFVIGTRRDTKESIESLRRFSVELAPDFCIYTALTPFPGTPYFDEAKRNGWIEDTNYTNYDMAHAIMPTESLTRTEVQEELYLCYKTFYGSILKNISGVFSKNRLKRTLYRHMAGQSVLKKFRRLI